MILAYSKIQQSFLFDMVAPVLLRIKHRQIYVFEMTFNSRSCFFFLLEIKLEKNPANRIYFGKMLFKSFKQYNYCRTYLGLFQYFFSFLFCFFFFWRMWCRVKAVSNLNIHVLKRPDGEKTSTQGYPPYYSFVQDVSKFVITQCSDKVGAYVN